MVIAGSLMLVCGQRCIPETSTTSGERHTITWNPRRAQKGHDVIYDDETKQILNVESLIIPQILNEPEQLKFARHNILDSTSSESTKSMRRAFGSQRATAEPRR